MGNYPDSDDRQDDERRMPNPIVNFWRKPIILILLHLLIKAITMPG